MQLLMAAPIAALLALPSIAGYAAATGECSNEGLIVQVSVMGQNSYCEGEACTNQGAYLAVGQTFSCYGRGIVVACVAARCETVAWPEVNAPGPEVALGGVPAAT